MYQLKYLGHSIAVGDILTIGDVSLRVVGFKHRRDELPLIKLKSLINSRTAHREWIEVCSDVPTAPTGSVAIDPFTGRLTINGEYGITAKFTGNYVCYTCGVYCECGDELGTCDECNSEYDTSSRNSRCGNCGNCAKCCTHVGDGDE